MLLAIAFFFLLGLAGLAFTKVDILRTFFDQISFVTNLVNPVDLAQTDGRVNVLVLGIDTRSSYGLYNTDTIVIGSVSLSEGRPVLISLPRDLWVDLSPYGYGRINTAYSLATAGGDGTFGEEKGLQFARQKIEGILGVPIHYFALVDFEGFKEIIDTLGGVEVCVERTFDDFAYPLAGKEAADLEERYEHLHFEAGCQMMGGEIALKYARSRMGTNDEGNDFSRARRQQKVITAIKDKIFSLNLILNVGKVATLYQKITQSVKTNLSLGELQRAFDLFGQEDLKNPKNFVLDPESGLVYHPADPSLYDGAYILLPTSGTFGPIHQVVQDLFFSAQ